MLNLTLVRHGETVGKSSEKLYGGTDIALSNLGIEQMKCVSNFFSGKNFDLVLTSPLQRSINSANIILEKAATQKRVVVEGFTEVNFGILEGMTVLEVQLKHPNLYKEWLLSKSDFIYPGGDSKKEFRKKVATATIKELTNIYGSVLAVLHKGVIKVILATLLEKDIKEFKSYPLELASIHTLKYDAKGWVLLESNYIDHLKKYRIESSK